MTCFHVNVPEYLHYYEGRKKYSSNKFRDYHLLYRTGFKDRDNPIEFPKITTTSISVCWSKLIKEKDVLKTILAENPSLGDHIYFGRVKKIKKFSLDSICEEGQFIGKHTLTNIIVHRPKVCNYAHAEILIRHTYSENNEIKSTIIEHEDWKKCLLYKGKPKEFFKKLDLRYRAAMATLLNNSLDELNIPLYLKIFPKHLVMQVLLFINIFLIPSKRE